MNNDIYNKIMEALDTALNNTPLEKAQDMFVTEAFNMIREEGATYFDLGVRIVENGKIREYSFDRVSRLLQKYISQENLAPYYFQIFVPVEHAATLDLRLCPNTDSNIVSDEHAAMWAEVFVKIYKNLAERCGSNVKSLHPFLRNIEYLANIESKSETYFKDCDRILDDLYSEIKRSIGKDRVHQIMGTSIGLIIRTIYDTAYRADPNDPLFTAFKSCLREVTYIPERTFSDQYELCRLGNLWHHIFTSEMELLDALNIPSDASPSLSRGYVAAALDGVLGDPSKEVCGLSITAGIKYRLRLEDEWHMGSVIQTIADIRNNRVHHR